MSRKKITGRERERDAAEEWLLKNDPEYATRRRSWQTPSTDALARDREEHPTLRELQSLGIPGDGNYRRFPNDGSLIIRQFENEFTRAIEPDEQSDG